MAKITLNELANNNSVLCYILTKFLIYNKCLFKFEHELRVQRNESIDDFVDRVSSGQNKVPLGQIIGASFSYGNSNVGVAFWRYISREWENLLIRIHNEDKNPFRQDIKEKSSYNSIW